MRQELKEKKMPIHGKKSEMINRLITSAKEQKQQQDLENGMKSFRIVLNRIDIHKYNNDTLEKNTKKQGEASTIDVRLTRSKTKQQQLDLESVPNETVLHDKVPAVIVRVTRSKKIQLQRDLESVSNETKQFAKLHDKVPAVDMRVKRPKTTQLQRDLESVSNETASQINKSIISNRNKRNRGRDSRKFVSSIICLKPSLRKYEMIWAHIKGYPNWPGIIEEETPKGKYRIHFFGDYTTSEVTKNKIMHLMEGFNKFTTVVAPTAQLTKAITEARYFVFDQNRNTCPICDMLLLKATTNT